MDRVRAYVDGWNLYHGIRASRQNGLHRRLLWLDLQRLTTSLLKPGQQLDGVNYFTARVRADQDAGQRQGAYLDALTAHSPLVRIIDGRFQPKRQRCRDCGSAWTTFEEKETDVAIAVHLVADAALNRFDTALIISADSDLCPAVRAVRGVAPTKRIIAAFPPRRHSGDLQRHVDAALTIGDAKLRQAQLPDIVPINGIKITRPTYWT